MESIMGHSSLDICGSLETTCSSNQENCIGREDVVASRQTISCNPRGEIFIEKAALIQRNVLVTEKIKIPSQTILPSEHCISAELVENCAIKVEPYIPEEMEDASQKSSCSIMEDASQKSSCSIMEVCSQESKMEVCSQESFSSAMDSLSQETRQTDEVCSEVSVQPELPGHSNVGGASSSVSPTNDLKRKHDEISLPQNATQARETILKLREIAVASRENAASTHEQFLKNLKNNLARNMKKYSTNPLKKLKRLSD